MKKTLGQTKVNFLKLNVVECPGYTRSEYLQDIKEKEEVEQIFKIATTCGLQGYPIIYYFIKDQNDQEAVFALSKNFPSFQFQQA